MIVTEKIPGSDTQRRVVAVNGVKVEPGLYRIFWQTGGASLAALGMTSKGDWWLAPTNWISPSDPFPLKHPTATGWSSIKDIERIHVDDNVELAPEMLQATEPYTAEYFKELREKSGLGMQQCKKILRGEELRGRLQFVRCHVAREILQALIEDHYPKRPEGC